MMDAVQCGACGSDNRASAVFCRACGLPLGRCAACGAGHDAGARFCDACGAALSVTAPVATPHAAIEGERRRVTILVADAVGSTPLAESLDEEELYRLMQGAVEHMTSAVERHGGLVAHFTGDGVEALFGAPLAHEDSARRAVAAALDMQAALARYYEDRRSSGAAACHFRIGLHTGPVVVGRISDRIALDYTALGDTANVAARMQQSAEPGAIYLSADVERLVRDYVDCERIGPQVVKGKAAPIVVFRAVKEKPVRSRFEAATARGLTPFVGRDHELEVLVAHLDEARRGRGRVVLVAGEPGIGKSRLLLELREDRGAGVTWLDGPCASYGGTIPYLPFVEILKRYCGIGELDSEAEIIGRIAAATRDWTAEARAGVPYLRYLLAVDPGDARVAAMDALERRPGVLDALRALVRELCRGHVLVLAIEDVHWIDERSAEVLEVLADMVADHPVLLLATLRPGTTLPLMSRASVHRVALAALDGEHVAALAAGAVGAQALPSGVAELVARTAEGNPLFIEEVTRTLLETGAVVARGAQVVAVQDVTTISIPATVQEVIQARIDRLDVPAREALQLGAVIGREFTVRLLERISALGERLTGALGELTTLELIFAGARFPELAYHFKHALTHDVAYSTLLHERRRALHLLIGAAIEELYADRLPEHYEDLARHYVNAEAWPKALEYLMLAADKAADNLASRGAIEAYARAVDVAIGMGDLVRATEAATQHSVLAASTGADGEAQHVLTRLLDAADAGGDRLAGATALAYLGELHITAHRFEEGERLLAAALERGAGLPDVETVAHTMLFTSCVVTNRHEEAAAHASFVAQPGRIRSNYIRLTAVGIASLTENWRGRYQAALGIIRGPHSEPDSAITLVGAHWVAALAHAGRGDYAEALQLLHEVEQMTARLDEIFYRARTLNTLGWIYFDLNDVARARTWNERGLNLARAAGLPDPECESNALLNLGDCHLAAGHFDDAAACFAAVEKIWRSPQPHEAWMLWRYAQHCLHSTGELWLARGDRVRAAAYADECLALAETSASAKNIVKALRLRGVARDDLVDLDRAAAAARELGNPPQLWRSLTALGDGLGRAGRHDPARAAYTEALSAIEGTARGLHDAALAEILRGSREAAALRAALEPVR